MRDADWRGWMLADRMPSAVGARDTALVIAPDSVARQHRVIERLTGSTTPAGARAALRDVLSWNAGQLVPLLSAVTAVDPIVEGARQRLLGWDRAVTPDSPDALLYVIWEHALRRRLGSLRIPSVLLDEFVVRSERVLVPSVTAPSNVWFDDDVVKGRNALLVDSLTAAIDDERRWTAADAAAVWGDFQRLTFRHPLAISPQARRRYDTGPFSLPGYHATLFATARATAERSLGPALEYVFDVSNWDASRAVIAPGQSAAPDSPHFADLAALWIRGDSATLRFSEAAITDVAETRLALLPK
jgi:penicillin amidase